MTKYEKLKQALLDDGLSETEASDLAQLDESLSKVPKAMIRQNHQAQLIKLVKAELPQRKTRREQFLELYPIALLLSQLRVIQRELWAASAIVMLIGVIVSLGNFNDFLFSFHILAPIVAAASVAMLYDTDFQAMLELEETSCASARVLLLARLSLVFGFNLILALIGSIVLSIANTELSLLPLIMAWLAPMSFLSGMAFFLSVIGRNSLFAAGFSLVLWIGHLIFTSMDSRVLFIQILSLPALSNPSYRPLLIFAGVLLVLASLWQVGIVDRKVEAP